MTFQSLGLVDDKANNESEPHPPYLIIREAWCSTPYQLVATAVCVIGLSAHDLKMTASLTMHQNPKIDWNQSSTSYTKTLRWMPPMNFPLSKSSEESRFLIVLNNDFFNHSNGAKMNININFFHNMMRFPKPNLNFWSGIGDLPTIINWDNKDLGPKRSRTFTRNETISFRSICFFLFSETKLM